MMHREQYGMHLSCRFADVERPSALADATSITEFLRSTVQSAGMRILAGPLVGEETGDTLRAGLSGVVILYESHAAIHTYPARSAFFLDIFSCRPFEESAIYSVVKRYFGETELLEAQILSRGVHWDTNPSVALDAWRAQRRL